MQNLLSNSWKGLAWRGAVSLLFGILAALWPSITLIWLMAMFAAYALIGGSAYAIAAIKNRQTNSDWWLLLLLGLMTVAAGAVAIIYPNLTAVFLVLLIGATALASGLVDIIMAIRLRKVIEGEALLFLNGIVSVAFGVFVFFFPGAGALALVWLISIYAIFSGVLLLALAWRARGWAEGHGTPPSTLPA
ncbi:MAG TPA: DUF308 domain-containing protein [Nitrosospira sp.]|jgi:uncharacterized membrane protein HdeD (DUF308 family)|nr:DUF308 domain-containing protein [Nitrosospira sp.]